MMNMVASKHSNLEKGVVQLIYCSHMSPAKHEIVYSRALDDILDRSAEFNYLQKISAILLTDRKFFAQVIEGSPPEINRLYKKILHDERHQCVTLLQHTVTNIRLFPQWPMTLVEVDDLAYVGNLAGQSTPGELRKACLLILRSLRPAFWGK